MTAQRRYRASRARSLYEGRTMGFASIIFGVVFVGIFAWNFLTTCIFHLPLTPDIGTCWNEQVRPAQMQAISEATQFIPGGAFYKR